VSVRTGQVLALADTPLHVKSKFFCIQDPIEPTDSLGRSLLEPHCRRVQRACREAALAILQSRTADALTVVFGAQNQPARPVGVPPPLPKPTGPAPPPLSGASAKASMMVLDAVPPPLPKATGPAPPPLPGSSSVALTTAARLTQAGTIAVGGGIGSAAAAGPVVQGVDSSAAEGAADEVDDDVEALLRVRVVIVQCCSIAVDIEPFNIFFWKMSLLPS
jgi:hypothetical protein